MVKTAHPAYEVAGYFRRLGVPVVMGGIHATLSLDEVMDRVIRLSPEKPKASGRRSSRTPVGTACSPGMMEDWQRQMTCRSPTL